MDKIQDKKLELLEGVLDSFKEEYRELSEVWKVLDSKAQGVIAIDGIFLAAIFAFIRTISAPTFFEKIGISAALVTFAVSILYAVSALWIKTVSAAPLGSDLKVLADDLMGIDETDKSERFYNFSRDHSSLWKSTTDDIYKINQDKASSLGSAQRYLIGAILISTILTIYEVWS